MWPGTILLRTWVSPSLRSISSKSSNSLVTQGPHATFAAEFPFVQLGKTQSFQGLTLIHVPTRISVSHIFDCL
jgi:hypothetical protein